MKILTKLLFPSGVALLLALGGGCTGAPGADGQNGKDGAPGAQGPQGEAGSPGTPGISPSLGSTFTGVASTAQGPLPEGVPVVAWLVDLDGNPVVGLGAGVTDANGAFSVVVAGFDAPNSSVVLEATLPGSNGKLHAFLSGTEQDVDPVSDGVYRIIHQIVTTTDGRSVIDFTPSEIEELLTASEAALQSESTDLSDAAAIHETLLAKVGMSFVSFSGGQAQAEVNSRVTVTPPAGVLIDWNGDPLVSLEQWDVDSEGEIDDGTDDAYDGMFYLTVNGTSFPYQNEAKLEDERQVVLGPQTDLGSSGLDVVRKIYAPEDGNWARFTEVLSNPGASDVTMDVNIDGNLGSDENVDTADFTSSGDQGVDAADFWLVNHQDSYDPALGFLFPGVSAASKSNDNISYAWTVTVPAGGMVTLMHWAFQRSDKDMLAIRDRLTSFGRFPPAEFYEGLTQAEVDASLNAGWLPNIVGDAGSCVPGESLTLTTAAESITAQVATDGSFVASLALASGDSVHVVGSLGTDLTLTVP